MKFRVALLCNGNIYSGNFLTKDEADNFILEYMELGEVTKYRILAIKKDKIIEDEHGIRK